MIFLIMVKHPKTCMICINMVKAERAELEINVFSISGVLFLIMMNKLNTQQIGRMHQIQINLWTLKTQTIPYIYQI